MTQQPMAVCVLCHPDDEFAIFGEIQAMVRAGQRVLFVYLTDGAYGGQSAAMRAEESRVVLRRLSIADEDIHFPGCQLRLGDTKLHERMADALDAAERIIDKD